jgi:hypothetical protein
MFMAVLFVNAARVDVAACTPGDTLPRTVIGAPMALRALPPRGRN